MMSIRRILFKDETSVTPTLLNFIVMEWKRLQIFATQKLYFFFLFSDVSIQNNLRVKKIFLYFNIQIDS
jgi:hypothetical protein